MKEKKHNRDLCLKFTKKCLIVQLLKAISRDILKPELRHFGGYEWPEGDGATLCKHWKVIRGGSYYKIGNLWLASVSQTKLGAGG